MTAVASPRPAWEVADILREHGDAFRAKFGALLSLEQKQALRQLAVCRTAALGGHVQRCLDCGHERIAYNSCRNRHCPKCQALARAHWLERQTAHLLPVEYFHVVFTLPQTLAALVQANARLLYDALLQTAAQTLRDVAANPRRLGAQVGMLLVLHTWGQNLHYHPHVHAVVTGGGLSCNPHGRVDPEPRWVACRPGFFLPVRVLSRVFRGKFLERLRQAYDAGQLVLPTALATLDHPDAFARWLTPLYRQEWVVYAKPPFGGPAQVLKYLARYTHGVAISNQRLLSLEDGQVTFRYKDYADSRRRKTMTLSAEEFLRRFVQHVLPRGFVKIRHYGLLAPRGRNGRLARCRRLLLPATVAARLTTSDEAAQDVRPAREPCCPHCGGTRLSFQELTVEAALRLGDVVADSS
jgi:Putative transposase/Transposase zinc-binding domain